MPFTRQRHNGTNETHPRSKEHPHSKAHPNRITRNRTLQFSPQIIGALALAAPVTLLNTHSAIARPRVKSTQYRKLPGAWGWTTGSQTYLRVRPSATTPAVAKVPRRTKMFVWGKY